MNSYERLFARMQGKPVDRVPNNCIIMGFGAKYIGASYREFVTDYRVLAEAALRCREDFDLDILSVISDPMREAEAFGSEIVFPENGVPYATRPLLQELSDISKLKVFSPEASRRTNDRLMAVRYLSEQAGSECAVQGWVEGAFAEACDLRDLYNMMIDVMLEPDAVKDLLEICTEGAIRFALAQIKAGARIIGIGDAAASLIGPQMYMEFAFPYEKRLIDEIHKAGGKAKLHICGNINKILDMVVETGADMIDCDWMVDFKRANELCGTTISACGNFDPVAVLLEGKVETVKNAVNTCLAQSSPTSIIAAGCEVPPDTPAENLKAVSQALWEAAG
ncbi:MAG TPA: uroporphyrinogen decarboxylase family protein [Candidatus Atribacteria bacterium]|mgnify:CR=1 FL=1|nr:uroporphyrinogen decarboxylase family protein [Candidatus Atribacteria bacterium]